MYPVKVLKLLEKQYSVGVWGIAHPKYEKEISFAKEYCTKLGIDFRIKEFLGKYKGKLYGTYKYKDFYKKVAQRVKCKTSELIIGCFGNIYRCHSDLYEGRKSIGHILDEKFQINNDFMQCDYFGFCNPCDIKIKTNRFQIYGHTSVEIVGVDLR